MADSLSTPQTSRPGSPSDFVPHISTSDDELHPSLPKVPDTGTDHLKQPVTPTRDSRIVDEVQGATPGSAKASAQQTLALKSVQGKQARPEWLTRLDKEMKDILVQMPVLDFLQRFVRGKEPMAEIKAKLAEIKLNKDKFTVQERHMYNDLCEFINTISDICSEGGVSGLKLVAKDTGANPDTSIGGDGSKNKPDVSIFPERDETHATCQPAMKAKKSTAKKNTAKKSAAKQGAANAKQAQTPFKAATSWHRASLVIECKSSNSDGHPFSFRPASTSKSTKPSGTSDKSTNAPGTSDKSTKAPGTSDKSTKAPGTSDKECDSAAPNPQAEKDVFLPQADEAIKSRGQLSDYAMHLMRSQPRQFCFMVVVAGCYARIMRWDRSGAIVSEAFEFVEDPSTMVTFLYNYMTMTQEERGFDMSVVEASDDDKKEMIAWKDRMVQDKELSDYHIERYKEAMETKWPIHKVTIPREDLISAAELEPKVDEASAPKDSPQAGSDIPTEDLTLLIGKPLSMSNSPTGRSTIGYVAFDIRGKRLVFMRDSWPYDSPLRKTERIVYKDLWQNGVTNIARPISGGIVKNGDKIHRTITQKYGNAEYGKDTRARIHFRLITDEVYEPLDNCKCSYELILVLTHYLAWTKADILHCDISRANVMVKRTGPKVGQVVGILIDWDLCKYKDQLNKGSSNPTHSGTWQFSSAMLLQYPMKLRQVSDDLESFVHVLHWTILMWYEHSLSGLPSELRRLVSRTYDEFETFGDYDTGGFDKYNYMLLGALPFADLSSEPLKALTENLAEICKEHYNASSTKEQRAKLGAIKVQKGKKSPSQPPAAPVEIDISVRHYNRVEHQGGHAKSSHTEDARPLLDTSTTPKLQEHFWIWHAFREVIEDMEKNRYTQITIDKVDKPQFTPATESATQQSTRGQKRPSQSSGESTRSSKKAKTTHGTRTMSSSMGTIFEEDEHSGDET
ncbi:predicted protein [Postia placenta Mad-698-R]|uniref:Fungal-type protein kinase domain-containing protein n=1 Tax=Postia placenta MAD-698-R-SB12 TaxID=670580 RepID=A0A1X6N7F5_9APHY|nr:hypothetical protein POSPLADRAFT_1137884 [Postia placenta MAD-698-R-SB12]EED83785.1 predicted protein [Postia placenta Mad-698-R]OSX64579.1 hypothetical protein POSPLADRAFT_1137884 [Postia placenta MAD-698-R-SB12]